jgi:SAM-dependent methyltransferase
MAGGSWGSRFPIGNLVCSKFIFAAAAWRMFACRRRNTLKRLIRGRPECLVNDPATGETLRGYLEAGYDKLNIGGGNKDLAGFVNIDFVPSDQVSRQVVANILDDLSFIPTGCASQIHCNHLLEHLTDEQLQRQLDEYHRILRPEGRLTVRCPNALGAAYGFWFGAILEEDREAFVAAGFPADEDFGNPADRWLDRDFYALLHWFYGDVGNIRNQHLSRITPSALANSLAEAGFDVAKMTAPEAVNIAVVAVKG